MIYPVSCWGKHRQRFVVFRFNEFGDDGGPLSKLWRPKFGVFKDNVSTHFGVQVPDIEASMPLQLLH